MKRTHETNIAAVYDKNFDTMQIVHPRTRITADQAYELSHKLAKSRLPKNCCCTAITTDFRTGYWIQTCTDQDSKSGEITYEPLTEEGFEATLYLGLGRKCKKCLTSLSQGKCTDKFVRKYIGALLYPKYYANEKQK